MTSERASQVTPAVPVFLSGFCTPEARKFVLVAAIPASSMGFIDGSLIAIAMPAIRTTLDASLTQAQWVHNAYMLTLSALILAGGARLADRFGTAPLLSLGSACVAVGYGAIALAVPE